MSKSASNAVTRVITPAAILSYPWLSEAQPPQQPGGKPMFSAALLFVPAIMAKYSKYGTSLDALKAAANAAAVDAFGDKLPALLRDPLFKTGFRSDWELKGYPEGTTYINARNQNRQGVVYLWPDATNPAVPMNVDADEVEKVFYPGAIVRAEVRSFGFAKSGNRGVSFALNNLQLIDGKAPRLDNRKSAQESFEADASAAPSSLSDLGADE